MTDRVYYGTIPVRKSGRTQTVHVNSEWGFQAGDWVQIVLWPVDNPGKKIIVTKKLSPRGRGIGFYCSSKWGLRNGELVTYRMRKVDGSDPGVEAETENP